MAGGDLTIQFNATGQFTLDRTFDYVDATVFGDTHRTYLVHGGTTQGAVDQMVNPLKALSIGYDKMKQKRTREQAALHRAAIRQLYNKIVGMTNLLSDEMAAAGIAADSTSDLITKLALEMRDVEREEAIEKAEWLLDQHMTDAQRKTWAKNRYIQIQGKDANVYRIGRDGDVSVWAKTDKGHKRRGAFCMYTTDATMPVADKILATKMYLEANEEGYLKEANFTSLNGYSFRKLQVDGELVPLPKTDRTNLYGNYRALMNDWIVFDDVNQNLRLALTNNEARAQVEDNTTETT